MPLSHVEPAVIQIAKAEPVWADTPRYGELFLRKHGRGCRRLAVRSRKLACTAVVRSASAVGRYPEPVKTPLEALIQSGVELHR